ncbi:MAG: preprotein translocase subunit SecG [Rhodocyclaceae bacterium]
MSSYLFSIVLTVHVLIGLAVIGLVLMQHGKGADMGAAFGSGASGSLFGASGSANFLSRMTAVLATLFFLTSLGLSYVAHNDGGAAKSVMDAVPAAASEAPAAPTDAPAGNPDSKALAIPK